MVDRRMEGPTRRGESRTCRRVHTAAPFPDSPSDTLASDDTNSDLYDALNRLEGALRTLFRRILAEPKFAELIADPAALDKEHPVQTRRQKRKD
jgi:hypothetical protein